MDEYLAQLGTELWNAKAEIRRLKRRIAELEAAAEPVEERRARYLYTGLYEPVTEAGLNADIEAALEESRLRRGIALTIPLTADRGELKRQIAGKR